MKAIISALMISIFVSACVTAPTSTGNSQTTSSSEMEARKLTEQMKSVLTLNTTQEEKVLVINVVNLSLLKKLRESNQTEQIQPTKEKYKNQMKEVLNSDQFNKFLVEFGNM